VLHMRVKHLRELVEGPGERGLLPAAGMASNAETPGGGAQGGEPHAVVGLERAVGSERLVAAEDQVIAVRADIHALREGALREELLESRPGGLAPCPVHSSRLHAYQRRPSQIQRNGFASSRPRCR